MSNIERRIERAEEVLSMDGEPVIHGIVHFGGPLPPEERRGNSIIRHVAYESIRERLDGRDKP